MSWVYCSYSFTQLSYQKKKYKDEEPTRNNHDRCCFSSSLFIYFQSQEAKKEWLQERSELTATIAAQDEKIAELEKGFSYLDELTDVERENYDSFLEMKNNADLIFSPEKTLLVYFHAVSNGDIEAIYALTDTTESLDDFSDRYQGSAQSYQDMESAMTYRYYDFVGILEGESTDDSDVNIEIAISLAGNKWVALYTLVKDGNNWKLKL